MLKQRTSLKLLISVILATISQVAIVLYATTATNDYHSMIYGFFAFVSLVVMSFLIYKAIDVANKRLLILSSIGGILISGFIVVGAALIQYEPTSKKTLLGIVGVAFFVTALIILFINAIPTIKHWLRNNYIENKFSKYFHSDSKKTFFIFWVIIFICFIPALLATWPGIFSYDGLIQINQFFGVSTFTAWHPPIHTIYLGLCFELGRLISPENNSLCMVIYSVTQMLVMSAIFAYACKFMCKNKAPSLIIILSTIFFGLFPVNQLFAVCSTKDVIFAGLVLLFVIFTIELTQKPRVFFCSKYLVIRYIICILLLCLFRNNAIYAFLIFIPFFLIYQKKFLLKAISICIASLILFWCVTGPVYSAFGVGDTSSVESLSVPIQQIAYTLTVDYENISEEDLQIIDEMFTPDLEEVRGVFDLITADNEKPKFNIEGFENNKEQYIKEYINLGMQFPQDYIVAFLGLVYPYFYPDFVYHSDTTTHPQYYINYDNLNGAGDLKSYIAIERESKLPKLDNIYQNISKNDAYSKIPCFGTFFSQGFILIICLFCVIEIIYKKHYKTLLCLILPAAILCTFLLGPIALTRYSYFLFLLLPICVCLTFSDILFYKQR